MAEVYDYGEGLVVKLDRPEWSGVSAFESEVITKMAEAGIPVARSHGIVTIDKRCGVVLDRVAGRELVASPAEANAHETVALARRCTELQVSINAIAVDGLPDLVARLQGELSAGALPPDLMEELSHDLTALDDGHRVICHYDFHPLNVMVSDTRWVVIDWLTVASGPPLADLARTLVLWGRWATTRPGRAGWPRVRSGSSPKRRKPGSWARRGGGGRPIPWPGSRFRPVRRRRVASGWP